MVDNLYPEGDADERRRPDATGTGRNAPLSDREVPIAGGQPVLVVQQWLDGEATEVAARRTSPKDVELWERINAETERRRRMTTPAPLYDRIMAAIPEAAPAEPLTWWRRPLALTGSAALAAAIGLLAVGAVIGSMLR
jgi:hypothetical protein